MHKISAGLAVFGKSGRRTAAELRKKLLAMTTSGGADNPAAKCLNLIDKIRDASGAPENEPRHPDLASGRAWPMLTPDPDAE